MVNLQAIGQDIVGGLYEEAKHGRYTPTLIVGLGGSGIKTLRYLKNVLRRHTVSHIELLGIDSDATENTKSLELPTLSQGELIILDQRAATALLARANAGQRDAKPVLDYLPAAKGRRKNLHQEVHRKIATQVGAGQFRRAGRLLFQANVDGGSNLATRFRQIYTRLNGMSTMIAQGAAGITIAPGSTIYIVTSLSGGTGAGVLPDCVALLRSQFSDAQDTITAFCFLPGPLLDQKLRDPRSEGPQTRANAVALLRELSAFHQGEMNDYRFQMEGRTLGPFPVFLNQAYLIDNRLYGTGTPANSYMELTQAMAYFLYSFVGAGVGAADAAGKVNPNAPSGFSALGVSAIEYPICDLATFAMRHSLGEWLQRWSKTPATPKQIKESVEKLLAAEPLDLQTPAALRARLSPGRAELRALRFLEDPQLRKTFLKQPDDVFVNQGLARVQNMDSLLQDMAPTFTRNAQRWQQEAFARIDGWVCQRVQAGLGDARNHVLNLKTALDKFAVTYAGERKARDAKIAKLADKIKRTAAQIHFWDFGLDRKLRNEFLSDINRYVDLKIAEKGDSYATSCLTSVTELTTSMEANVKNLHNAATQWARENKREMERLRDRDETMGFVQSIVPYAKFPKWARENAIAVPDFPVQTLQWIDIINEAIAGIMEGLRPVLANLDLVVDAMKNPTLALRVDTLNMASGPLLHMVSEAPPMGAMQPQKFVAGKFAVGDSVFMSHFSAPEGGSAVEFVQTDNRHLLTCVQTCHGFAPAHWRLFDEARAYYRDDPWYAHVLERCETLPPLVALAEEESKVFRLFGLGLMFDLILSRGTNYYKNMVVSDREERCYFLVGAGNRSDEAKVLLKTGLIEELPAPHKKVRRENHLGKSLESAIKELSTPGLAECRRQLDEIVDDFKLDQGAQATKNLVNNYVSSRLATLLGRAQQRRDILEKVSTALLEYVEQLT